MLPKTPCDCAVIAGIYFPSYTKVWLNEKIYKFISFPWFRTKIPKKVIKTTLFPRLESMFSHTLFRYFIFMNFAHWKQMKIGMHRVMSQKFFIGSQIMTSFMSRKQTIISTYTKTDFCVRILSRWHARSSCLN